MQYSPHANKIETARGRKEKEQNPQIWEYIDLGSTWQAVAE